MPAGAFLKSLVAWFAILCLAIANGALREAVLIPSVGRTPALVASGVLLMLAIVVVAACFVRVVRGVTLAGALKVGVFWVSLTLAFEFGFGRLVQHKSWPELLAAYTFRDGNIWPLVLLTTLVAPALAAKLHSTRSKA